MVLIRRRPATATPAFIVPDEQSWTVWGFDPASEQLEATLDLGAVRLALLPEPVPSVLAQALEACVKDLPDGVEFRHRPAAQLAGTVGAGMHSGQHRQEHQDHGVHGQPGHEQHGRHEAHAGHEGHEAHAGHEAHSGHKPHAGHEGHRGHSHAHMMMEITGEPSADGLVMEPMTFAVGPLASPLPAGLVVDVELDGDVVAECSAHATLRQAPTQPGSIPAAPDLLAPVAWTVALLEATGSTAGTTPCVRWLRLASIELERAVSHTAWLRAVGRLLAWLPLIDACTDALAPLMSARTHLPVELAAPDLPDVDGDTLGAALGAASCAAQTLHDLCEDSRRLRLRTSGRGAIPSGRVRETGLRGPSARACGLTDDARADDPLYRELGFAPAVRHDGDVRARILLHVDELRAAIALSEGALRRADARADAPAASRSSASVTFEGPRGPLLAQRTPRDWLLSSPGEQAARTVAGQSARDLEWAAALVVLASFDLSPWTVGP